MIDLDQIYSAYNILRVPLPTEERVVQLERAIGSPLPPKYRSFLMNYNGGDFNDPDIITRNASTPKDRLDCLYAIDSADRSINLADALGVFDNNKPVKVLPIGYTVMGSLIILSLENRVSEQIVMKLAHRDKYYFLADDILDFFSLLRPQSE